MEREQNAKDDGQSEFDGRYATGSFCPKCPFYFCVGLYLLLLYLFLCAVMSEEEWSIKAARSSDEPLFWFVCAESVPRWCKETERKENEKAILDVRLSIDDSTRFQCVRQDKRQTGNFGGGRNT